MAGADLDSSHYERQKRGITLSLLNLTSFHHIKLPFPFVFHPIHVV